MSNDKEVFLRRQRALAAFGEFALQSENLDAVLTEACHLVSEAMETDRAKVLEIDGEGEYLLCEPAWAGTPTSSARFAGL